MKGRSIIMKLTFWQRCAVAVAGGVAVLGAASPAFAIAADTTGVTAYGNKDGDWYVYDSLCDERPVYGRFVEKGTAGIQRKNNNLGCEKKTAGDLGRAILRVQACLDRPGADLCSIWNEH